MGDSAPAPYPLTRHSMDTLVFRSGTCLIQLRGRLKVGKKDTTQRREGERGGASHQTLPCAGVCYPSHAAAARAALPHTVRAFQRPLSLCVAPLVRVDVGVFLPLRRPHLARRMHRMAGHFAVKRSRDLFYNEHGKASADAEEDRCGCTAVRPCRMLLALRPVLRPDPLVSALE